MTTDELYAALKPDVERLALTLFDAVRVPLQKDGGFLPVGAVLSTSDQVQLVIGGPDGPEDSLTSAPDVLPLVHEGLRQIAAEPTMKAVAVCEDVTIQLEGERQTRAVKVLVEHSQGLCVALYAPCSKRFLRGWVFGEIFVRPADPEVRPSFGEAG